MSYWDDFENNFKILGIYTKILILHYQEPVVGSVIQASGTVEFEDGLQIGNHLVSKWPAEGQLGQHYTWGSTRGGEHTLVPPGAD